MSLACLRAFYKHCPRWCVLWWGLYCCSCVAHVAGFRGRCKPTDPRIHGANGKYPGMWDVATVLLHPLACVRARLAACARRRMPCLRHRVWPCCVVLAHCCSPSSNTLTRVVTYVHTDWRGGSRSWRSYPCLSLRTVPRSPLQNGSSTQYRAISTFDLVSFSLPFFPVRIHTQA